MRLEPIKVVVVVVGVASGQGGWRGSTTTRVVAWVPVVTWREMGWGLCR